MKGNSGFGKAAGKDRIFMTSAKLTGINRHNRYS